MVTLLEITRFGVTNITLPREENYSSKPQQYEVLVNGAKRWHYYSEGEGAFIAGKCMDPYQHMVEYKVHLSGGFTVRMEVSLS